MGALILLAFIRDIWEGARESEAFGRKCTISPPGRLGDDTIIRRMVRFDEYSR